MSPTPERPAVGCVYVATRSRTGRRWRVANAMPGERWRLVPIGGAWGYGGSDPGGQLTGGVRPLVRGTEELTDTKRWRRAE